jgi:hypothetical protein
VQASITGKTTLQEEVFVECNANADFFAGHKVAENQMPGWNFFNDVSSH